MLLLGGGAATFLAGLEAAGFAAAGFPAGTRTAVPHSGHLIAFPRARSGAFRTFPHSGQRTLTGITNGSRPLVDGPLPLYQLGRRLHPFFEAFAATGEKAVGQ